MKRTARVLKDVFTTPSIVIRVKEKAELLKKEIAYLEMREATGTKNSVSLIDFLNKQYNTDSFSGQ